MTLRELLNCSVTLHNRDDGVVVIWVVRIICVNLQKGLCWHIVSII